ncbi:MAG: hypothetical protein WB579_20510, partial [Bryobacteraceae bacterium]
MTLGSAGLTARATVLGFIPLGGPSGSGCRDIKYRNEFLAATGRAGHARPLQAVEWGRRFRLPTDASQWKASL